MRALRRSLQAIALIGTLIVGLVALALITSQTPWFRDWLRRYIVRESKQYLNGELTIGRLSGNLFFGVSLSDVAVDVSGSRVIAVKGLEVDYNVFRLLAGAIVLDELKIVEPKLRVERNGEGWNLKNLVKAQRREADREGPARPIALESIEVADGSLEIADTHPSSGYRLPDRIDGLDVRASFAYEPVRYSLAVQHVSFTSATPRFTLQELTGGVAVREDDLYLERVNVRTSDSAVTLDGVIRDYLGTPVLNVTTTGRVSLPEIARVVPGAEGFGLHPAFEIKANGPADRLALDLNVRSEAGDVRGRVTADVKAPELGISGQVHAEHLNLAPILRSPRQKSDVTGDAKVDLRLAEPSGRQTVLDRLRGSYQFSGPRVQAAGYQAANVRATGTLEGGRITIDGRGDAYGGTATASGAIRPASGTRPFAYELKGRAERVNLKLLPRSTGAPPLDTNLSVASYEVRGEGRTLEASATLNRSEIEGATFAEGTAGRVSARGRDLSYSARGTVENLDLQRVGRVMHIVALDKPLYQSRINGQFEMSASGRTLDALVLDASGTLTDTALLGARMDQMSFKTRLANRALDGTANGGFAELDPAYLSDRPALAGRVAGRVNARVQIADISAPITPEALTANGEVTLAPSKIGDVEIERAALKADYANRVGDISTLEVTAPDLNVTASGRLSLDETSASALKYRIQSTDLAAVGRLAEQTDIDGTAVVDGEVTGNATSLIATGRLDGSNLTYGQHNALDLNTQYSVTIPNLDAAQAQVTATTDATFLKVGGVQINSLHATTTYAAQKLDFAAKVTDPSRELEAKGQLILHPDHQEVHLPEFALRTQGIEWRNAGGEAAIQYGQDRLTLDSVRLVSGDQSLEVKGTLALRGADTSGALDVAASNVDLAQLERLTLQERGLSGRLTANARISGTAERPVVDGRVEILGGGFRDYRYESLTADVDYAGTRIELDAKLQQSPTEQITARGTLPMTLFSGGEEGGHREATADDRADLRIQSDHLGLGMVQGLTTAVTNVTGTLQVDVRVTGSGRDPHFEGHIDIRNGAFGVPAGGVSYRGLDTRLDLQQDVIRIQSFMILDEHGQPLAVAGQMALHERKVGAVDIQLQSDNFEIIDNELGDVGLDSKLKITGDVRHPHIEGEIRLEAARIDLDPLLQRFQDPYAVSAIPEVQEAERAAERSGSAEAATRAALVQNPAAAAARAEPAPGEGEAAAPPSAFSAVSMNVHLIVPDNLVLRGKNLRPGRRRAGVGDVNITVGGDLYVRKEPAKPITLVGTVTTVRGTYAFQGRQFELLRGGTLRFVGDAELNPIIDITARREIPNTGVEARIHVKGSLKNPELQLSSTPPLDESDILSLVVFNRPVNELGSGERASLASTAGGIATGFLAAPLGESIGRALDLDLFEITTTTDQGDLGAGVTIGQQIGDRAFFKLRQQFGRQNTSEFLIEYQLARFLRLQASAAPETSGSANRLNQRRVERAGIDLIFFFSY